MAKSKSKKKKLGHCDTCGHRTACIINDGKEVDPCPDRLCGMYMPQDLFENSDINDVCGNCRHLGEPHWFNDINHRDEIEKYSFACTHDIEDKIHPHAAEYFVRKNNKACIFFECKEDNKMPKQTYYTKCGREFRKSSTAVVTGYDIDLREDGTISEVYQVLKKEAREALTECADCPFRVSVKEGWPPVHKKWECRAGSKPPNHTTEWTGSLCDKNTISIHGLDHQLMEEIRQYCEDHPDLGASYNADHIADCRRTLSINCSQNKMGIASKRELIEKFFPADAAEQSKRIVDTFCGDCELGKTGELADHVRCGFNGRLMHTKHESCPNFKGAKCDTMTDTAKRRHCASCHTGHWFSGAYTYVSVVADDGIKTTKRPCEPNTHYCNQVDSGQKIIASDKDFDPNAAPEWCPLEKNKLNSQPSVNDDQKEDKDAPPANKGHKPHCPYLSSHGEKFIDCNAPNARRLNTVNFDSKKECSDKTDRHCYAHFMDCEDYRKYYADPTTWEDWAVPERRTNYKACIYCCNNSWHTGLPEGYSGQEYCYCQKKQMPVKHDSLPCDWFNRHPDWKLPRIGLKDGCLIMKADCPCFCDHNDGCAVLLATGGALKRTIEEFNKKYTISCAVYQKVSQKVLQKELQSSVMSNGDNNEGEDGCQHSDYADAHLALIKATPNETQDSKLLSRLAFIRQKAFDIIDHYVEIGFALIEIRDSKLFKENGYETLAECIETELNIKKSTAYNLMKIAESFGDVSTRRLKPEYSKYNYVQCLEMSTMTEKELSLVNPDMSKREMKRLKKSNRLENELKSDVGLPDIGHDIMDPGQTIIDVTDYRSVGMEATITDPIGSLPYPAGSDKSIEIDGSETGAYDENCCNGTPLGTTGICRPMLDRKTKNEIDHKLSIARSCVHFAVNVLDEINQDLYSENDINVSKHRCIKIMNGMLSDLRLLKTDEETEYKNFSVYVNDSDNELIDRLAAANAMIKKLETSLKQSQDAHKSKNDIHKDEVKRLNDKITELTIQLQDYQLTGFKKALK